MRCAHCGGPVISEGVDFETRGETAVCLHCGREALSRPAGATTWRKEGNMLRAPVPQVRIWGGQGPRVPVLTYCEAATIAMLRGAGASVAEIVAAWGCSEATVWRIWAGRYSARGDLGGAA